MGITERELSESLKAQLLAGGSFQRKSVKLPLTSSTSTINIPSSIDLLNYRYELRIDDSYVPDDEYSIDISTRQLKLSKTINENSKVNMICYWNSLGDTSIYQIISYVGSGIINEDTSTCNITISTNGKSISYIDNLRLIFIADKDYLATPIKLNINGIGDVELLSSTDKSPVCELFAGVPYEIFMIDKKFILMNGNNSIRTSNNGKFRNRGEWKPDIEYYNNEQYIDMVLYNGTIYISKIETNIAQSFNIDNWEVFIPKSDVEVENKDIDFDTWS